MSNTAKISINAVYSEQPHSIDDLKKILNKDEDEKLIIFLFDLLIERIKDIDSEDKDFDFYKKGTIRLFEHIQEFILEKRYSTKATIDKKLDKIDDLSSVAKSKIEFRSNIDNKDEEDLHILDFISDESEWCRSLLDLMEKEKTGCENKISNTNNLYSPPSIILNDTVLDNILSRYYNPKEGLFDFSKEFVLSIDDDKTCIMDDALYIEKFGKYILLGIFATNIGGAFDINSEVGQTAVQKGINGQKIFSKDIMNMYSLNQGIIKNAIGCVVCLDRDGNLLDDNSVRFVSSKIKVCRQLIRSDIPGILSKRNLSNVELKQKIQILYDISSALYDKKMSAKPWVFKTNRLLADEDNVAPRIVEELTEFAGSLARSYADKHQYPFMRYITFWDIQKDQQLIKRLRISDNLLSSIMSNDSGSLRGFKYFFSSANDPGYGHFCAGLWKFNNYLNQCAMNKCFLTANPRDKDIQDLEKKFREIADALNSTQPKMKSKVMNSGKVISSRR